MAALFNEYAGFLDPSLHYLQYIDMEQGGNTWICWKCFKRKRNWECLPRSKKDLPNAEMDPKRPRRVPTSQGRPLPNREGEARGGAVLGQGPQKKNTYEITIMPLIFFTKTTTKYIYNACAYINIGMPCCKWLMVYASTNRSCVRLPFGKS